MLRDADGQLSGPNAPALMQVASSSSVPVLSTIQTHYGRGVIGGSSPNYDLHGRAAGEIARRILQGVDPDTIDVKAVPAPRCEVDWYALQRWHVEEGNVPAACTLANRPPDAWRTHLWQITIAAGIIVAQGALLFALLVQGRRRRIAEVRLQARTADLAQESRISMIGALTANLAHEINQPIGAILSNAEAAQIMLEQGTLTPEKLREILNDIRADDLRASEVIRTLRSLFARSQWRPTTIETNAEVAEALRHVEFEAARRQVKLMPNYGSHMPRVLGDSVQLQQVVINLVVNAIEAVAHLAGIRREVRIETSADSSGVAIAVTDEGPGLSPEDAHRLFESTFTTKRESMGFGLSIVRSIVEMHRGRVWFEPNVPRGAVFRVWLPGSARERPRRDAGVVHVVDDDRAFRTAIGRVLTPRDIARACMHRHRSTCLPDSEGPRASSWTCECRHHRARPAGRLAAREDRIRDLPVGPRGRPSTVRAMRNGALDFLTKPVPTVVLLEAIRVALDATSSARRLAHCGDQAALRFAHAARAPGDVGRRRGRLNKQICYALHSAERTVKTHRARDGEDGRQFRRRLVRRAEELSSAGVTLEPIPDA